MWQPETWVQLLQPVVNFINQVVQRFGCNTQEQLLQMQQSVASLNVAATIFKQSGRCSGDNSMLNNLSNLDRQASANPGFGLFAQLPIFRTFQREYITSTKNVL